MPIPKSQNEIVLTLPRPHTGRTMGGQARIIREMKRFNVMDMGRRFGKTDLCEILIAKPLLNGFPVGWFAPTYKILEDAWQEILRLYAPVITSKNKTEKRINFITGGVLEGWTLDKEGAARGRKYKRIVIDEASRVKNLVDVFNYDLRPTLLDYSGDAFFPSTPKGLNDFHKLWMIAGNSPQDWGRWQMPTNENPFIKPEEITAMRATMPDKVARQELDAEFLEDGSFFQNVDACCVIEAQANPADHLGHKFFAGLDWALTGDFTRLTVLCVTCGIAVDWWGGNRMDYTMQRGFIVDRLKRWVGVILLPERNSMGAPNIENLASVGVKIALGPDSGLGFNTTSSSKNQLIMTLALAMEKTEILLPLEYADEIRAYEVEILTTNPKFSAPPGQHDDKVISAALAWWAACNSRMQIF